MITAVDTNILLDLLIPNREFVEGSSQALEAASADGPLVTSDIAYAELCCHFTTQQQCEEFLSAATLRVEGLTRKAHFIASRAWRDYRKQGGKRDRILPDFMIGAHAATQASRLLTRDRGFYRKLFPKLPLLNPAQKTPVPN